MHATGFVRVGCAVRCEESGGDAGHDGGEHLRFAEDLQDLARQAELLTLHVIGAPADSYIHAKYREYHSIPEVIVRFTAISRFDRFLVKFATRSRFQLRLADAYSAVFRREAVLRQKLVLIAALIECSPAHYRTMDRAPSKSVLAATLRMASGVLVFAVCAFAGMLVLVPVKWCMSIRDDAQGHEPC